MATRNTWTYMGDEVVDWGTFESGTWPKPTLAALGWRWPHIDPHKEWADHESGALLYVPAFLDKVESLRAVVSRPLIISSGYRTPEHNAKVSNTGNDGPHTTGRALDIAASGGFVLKLIDAALKLGFTGVGLRQHGPIGGRIVHLDDLRAPDYPRPTLWTYPS